jgi:putative ATP-dependent endonuclease of OLD family
MNELVISRLPVLEESQSSISEVPETVANSIGLAPKLSGIKISKLEVKNFRLLKEFALCLEDTLSLVIGKNNCGKTSLLSLLEKFLPDSLYNNFSFDDFNVACQKEMKAIIESEKEIPDTIKLGLSLKLTISYTEVDNIGNLSELMLDLDPDCREVIVLFEYSITQDALMRLRSDYLKTIKENSDASDAETKKDIIYFLKKNHKKYFTISKKALEVGNESNYIDLIKERITLKKIINFKRIGAKREVSNPKFNREDKTLSKMSAKYYTMLSSPVDEEESIIKLREELNKADIGLNKVYSKLFESVINKVKTFGGIKDGDTLINIISTLEERNILSENTTVTYDHSSHRLPEDYNGLGYLNLISMIFEIEVLMNEFKNRKEISEPPADINLLFIEEPEAHTHPQMQYVFIKNIKKLLYDSAQGLEDKSPINLQTIITTHSSHITAESDFDDIKYFLRQDADNVIAKNLKDLKIEYQSKLEQYQFLKQYLTLNRTELFFADKAILIEGDTERLFFTSFMQKMDNEDKSEGLFPLLSQNISIVVVGAYSHIFERLINFLEIKTLIITDLDSCDANGEKCRVSEGKSSSNSSLNFFFPKTSLIEKVGLAFRNKIFKKGDSEWEPDENGNLCVVFQVKDTNDYIGRTFEDAFISENLSFIKEKRNSFSNLSKKQRKLLNDQTDPYAIAETCINKKTAFALDVLFYSDENYKNWKIPTYIEEGLLWLRT